MSKHVTLSFLGPFRAMLLLTIAVLCLSLVAHGQGVGIGTASFSPVSDAALELRSTRSGLLITRMTRTQRDAIVNPSEGLLIYQTDNGSGFYYFNGVEWVPFINGNVVVSSIDNLGNHQAEQDVVLHGNSLVNAAGGGGIQINDQGRVSIGNAEALSPLAVQGSSVPNFEGQNNGVISVACEKVPFNFVPVDFVHDESAYPMARIAAQMTGLGAKLALGTSSNATLGVTNTAMTIDETGNIGIGTKLPGRRLEVMNGDIHISRTLGDAGKISMQGTGAGATTFRAGAQGAGDISYTLPLQQGEVGTILSNNGAGDLNWSSFTLLLGTATRAVNGNGVSQVSNITTFTDLNQMSLSVEPGTYIVLFNAQFTMTTGNTIGEFGIHCESNVLTESLRQVMAPANNAPGNISIMSVLSVTSSSVAKIVFRRMVGGDCSVSGRTFILIRIV